MMAQAPSKPNWFAIWISVAVVVVLIAVGGVVVWLNNFQNSGGNAPSAGNIDQETGAISFGEGPDTVATYIDFMCPICNQFEQIYGDTLDELVEGGDIQLDIHPIAILDRYSQGTEYSTRAANAMYCVAENSPDNALAFMKAMYTNQPEENSTGLTDDEIIGIAEGVGATNVSECITGGEYDTFVTAMTKTLPGQGTPTVVINGDVIELTGDPQVDIVDRLQG